MKTKRTNRIVETCKSLLEKYPKRRSFVLAKAAKFLQESGMELVEIAEALHEALHSSEGCDAEIEEIKTAIAPLGSESEVKQAIETLGEAEEYMADAERKKIEAAFRSCQT